MEYKSVLDIFQQGIGWVGLLILSPMLFCFSYVLMQYLINRFFPVTKITIEHIHDGVVQSTTEIDLCSKDPIIKQLDNLSKRKKSNCAM